MPSSRNSSRPDAGFDTLKTAFEKWEHSESPSTTPKKEELNMKKENSSMMFWGRFAILATGGYVLWRNRFKVQQFLESKGVSTPWMNRNIGDAIQSGVAKLSGSAEHEVKSTVTSMSNLGKDVSKAV